MLEEILLLSYCQMRCGGGKATAGHGKIIWILTFALINFV